MRNILLVFALLLIAAPAQAGLEVCNKTDRLVYLAIAKPDKHSSWASEGWWRIKPRTCATPISGKLKSRYYYVFAESGQFKWSGSYTFCIKAERFLIYGDHNCKARGYKTERFFRVETGPHSTSHTENLLLGKPYFITKNATFRYKGVASCGQKWRVHQEAQLACRKLMGNYKKAYMVYMNTLQYVIANQDSRHWMEGPWYDRVRKCRGWGSVRCTFKVQ
jgi:uncharacterized membrane protein